MTEIIANKKSDQRPGIKIKNHRTLPFFLSGHNTATSKHFQSSYPKLTSKSRVFPLSTAKSFTSHNINNNNLFSTSLAHFQTFDSSSFVSKAYDNLSPTQNDFSELAKKVINFQTFKKSRTPSDQNLETKLIEKEKPDTVLQITKKNSRKNEFSTNNKLISSIINQIEENKTNKNLYVFDKFDKESFWEKFEKYFKKQINSQAQNNTEEIPHDMLVPLICSRVPQSRELKDLHLVSQWLQTVNLIGNLPYRLLLKIAEKLEARVYLEGKVLCYEKTQGNCAYIIYEGHIGVFKENNDKCLSVFKSGDLCGNQALDNNTTRSATLKALKKSIVLLLSKFDYQSIMGSYFIEKQKKVANFLKLQIYCVKMNDVQIELFSKSLIWNFFKADKGKSNKTVIFNQGDAIQNAYILKSGKLNACHWFDVNFDNKWPDEKGWKKMTVVRKYEIIEEFEKGEIAGLDDILQNKSVYSYTLETVGKCKLLAINKDILKNGFSSLIPLDKLFEAYLNKRKNIFANLRQNMLSEIKATKKMETIMKKTFCQISLKNSQKNKQPQIFGQNSTNYPLPRINKNLLGSNYISNSKFVSTVRFLSIQQLFTLERGGINWEN